MRRQQDIYKQKCVANVLKMFKAHDYSETSLLSQIRLREIFNKQAQINQQKNFNNQIFQELWNQTQALSKGATTVLTFSQILADAIFILKDRLSKLNDYQTGLPKRRKLLEEAKKTLALQQSDYDNGYIDNYDQIISKRKQINKMEMKLIELEENKKSFDKELEEIQDCIRVEEKKEEIPVRVADILNIALQQSLTEVPSSHLKTIFFTTLVGLLIELPLLTFRLSLFSLLCYIFIVYWLFYGYYDQNFMKFIIVSLCLSVIFDLAHLVLEALGKLGTQRFTGYGIITIIAMAFLIFQVAIRIFLVTKLCEYFQPNSKRQYFQLFGSKIYLHKRSGRQSMQEHK